MIYRALAARRLGFKPERSEAESRRVFRSGRAPVIRPSGGRTWWAHFEFTRINIEPIILREKFEEARDIAKRCGVCGE